MDYSDIIRENCIKHSPVSWWPKFAFHYTDVRNAANILSSGYLYSRISAASHGLMQNDNASRQVIDMTDNNVTSMVRFYFRPLTPTQYYNEGYKHPALRYDHDENANVPVPIFLLFDLEGILRIPGVQFSETSQAGHGSPRHSGIEAFSQLNFDYIYDNSFENFQATKNYRHAEIVHPDAMPIQPYIRNVLCRNNLDRVTLLNLLKEHDPKAFIRYKDIIKVYKQDTFQSNGFFITECILHNNTLSISFSDTYEKRRYIERMMEKFELETLPPVKMKIWFKWANRRGELKRVAVDAEVNVLSTRSLTVKKIQAVPGARELGIEILIDGKLVYCMVQPVEDSEVLG